MNPYQADTMNANLERIANALEKFVALAEKNV